MLMKKSLLALTLSATLVAGAQTTTPNVTLNWATPVFAKTTAGDYDVSKAYGATLLEDGSYIAAITSNKASEINIFNTKIELSNDGTVTFPTNLTIVKWDSNGNLKWHFSSTVGVINKIDDNFTPVVVPGKDLALFAFAARFNASATEGENLNEIFKITDATGAEFSVPMECPSNYRPNKYILMFFKPSDGAIVSLKTIESEYSTNVENKYIYNPLTVANAVASSDAFYLTGYAMTKTTFADDISFTPSVPSDWNGTSGYEASFTVKYDLTGKAIKLVTDVATTDGSEKNAIIGTDGTYFYTVGSTGKTVYGFAYNRDLVKIGELNFPLTGASDGKITLQLRQINVSATGIYVTGAIKGGFEGTDLSTATLGDTGNHGFVAHINPITKKIVGGYVDPLSISAYYGCYLINGTYFVPGYNLSGKIAYLQPLTNNWTAENKITLLTSSSTVTMVPSCFDSSNKRLVTSTVSNGNFKIGDTMLSTDINKNSSVYACFTIDNGAGVDNVTANENGVKVAGGNGCINISTNAPAQVNIYNLAGICVKSVNVDGECTVDLAPGFYIADGKKVAVK